MTASNLSNKPASPSLDISSDAAAEVASDRNVDLDSVAVTRWDREQLRRLQRQRDVSSQRFAAAVDAAIIRFQIRQQTAFQIQYPAELPISAHADSIVQMIRDHQVIVVCGETGSGKSTQLPKMCWDAGLGREGTIGHTQPRRLAARSIADRLAEETQTMLGQQVGYQIRFGDQTSESTTIKLMTDGILLAESTSDPDLLAYDVLIIDEAHERSLNIDFLIGYLRQLMQRRDDIKVIITSATIDADRFSEHFAGAPIVQVEGRGYPVEIRYLPWTEIAPEDERAPDLSRHVIAAVESLRREGTGDALVFLPTERDIREVSHHVAGHFKRLGLANRVECLPLYSRLPQSQQQAIFHPTGGKQRLIFATNVAESSLTVPGIRYVIDSGTARISRYSPRSKVQRLPIESVSRASANQRSGRCGRVGPGICVRLYDDEDFRNRPEFTTPEIRRTNLASVILQSKTLRLGRLQDFPLLDVPREESIREGIRTLAELGAIDERQELTPIGWKLGRLPVDPRVGRMLIAGSEFGVLSDVLPIAAALEIQDPRDRPPDKRDAADQAHAEFIDTESDFLSYLRLWRWYNTMRSEHGSGKLTRILRNKFLSPTRMREWSDVVRQLREMAKSQLKESADVAPALPKPTLVEGQILDPERSALVHQALLCGLLSGVAMAGETNEYTGAGGLKLFLWPGSGLSKSKPKWIMAAELVETSRQYARVVAKIQPAWIESVGGHVLKANYSDPTWSGKSSSAFCYQRLSLFGLPVVSGRRVPLAPIDPATARDMLIRHGLVGCDLPTTAGFVRHNRSLIESIERLAAKTRRRDLVIDDYRLLSFYQSRLPDWVVDRPRMEKFDRSCEKPVWLKNLKDDVEVANWIATPPHFGDELQTTPYLTPNDLLDISGPVIAPEDFPDQFAAGGSSLPLSYHFAPGTENDGISLTIHPAALPQISDDSLGWLVPGLLQPKITAMIKSLPKRIRRNLVPAADVAATVAREIAPKRGQDSFLRALCESLTRHAEMPVNPNDFQDEKLEPHLEFLVRVVDDQGREIARDRGVDAIKQSLGNHPAASVVHEASTQTDQDWSRKGMKDWEFDELPVEVTRVRGGVRVAQFPGLIDEGETVGTALFADPAVADASTRAGLVRLMSIACRKDLKTQVRHLPRLADAKIKLAPLIGSAAFESALADLIVRVGLVDGQPIIRTRQQWETRLSSSGSRIAIATQEIASWLGSWTDGYHEMRVRWEGTKSPRSESARRDVIGQLEWLLADGFLCFTPWQHLQHFPRYLQAIAYRLDRVAAGGAARDAESTEVIERLWSRWLAALPVDARDARSQSHGEFRWLIEELRVSQFAQPLGTSVKVSPQRCEKLLS